MFLFFLSLLAGVLTVLAPCTISLLPVIVGGSMTSGSMRRAFVVTTSLGISVLVFTFALKVSSAFIMVPEVFWQTLSGVIIILIGFSMLFPVLWEKIPVLNLLSRSSNKVIGEGYRLHNFWGDVIIGAALGPVFSSCSPTYFLIIAAVLPASVAMGTLYLLAYTVGLCAALLIVTFAGQKLLGRFAGASDPNSWFKRAIGILFIVIGLLILTGYEAKLESSLVGTGYDITTIEQYFLAQQKPQSAPAPIQPPATSTLPASPTNQTPGKVPAAPAVLSAAERIAAKSKLYFRAPEITNPSGFVNTGGQPITFGQFIGKKVILVDFWTYSCINCQRTLPYLKAWDDKYRDQGLEIIGIHTPEFAFEKLQSNVENAVKGFGLKYPSVLDNDYGTWNAFGNQFWPNKYLIDIDGFVVYEHAGEGNYDVTEAAIQKALKERSQVLGDQMNVSSGTVAPTGVISVSPGQVDSPETYFGSHRNEFLANGTPGVTGVQTFTLPETLQANKLYLDGSWNITPEYAETGGATDSIVFNYNAKNVYFVASSASGATLSILVDGQIVNTVKVSDNKLYQLVNGAGYGAHKLQIWIMGGNLQAYTFTFG